MGKEQKSLLQEEAAFPDVECDMSLQRKGSFLLQVCKSSLTLTQRYKSAI